ncbi:putative Enoyl-CoA hydratase [Nitrospira sp. KM1]|uniref:enoyl-CoA hydratase-related protein n=1 Tax=Nitrospira sp. KM1 TaxID=1936990 RepID=UPI0013A76396|nr:enoyl-CoA hydratase-related protein [Nitrospira sp. KM1]BCA53348.1 putative Enoyl-CoA hydratase [Nitrospira sp. KM1]
MAEQAPILVESSKGLTRVTLNRPDRRNAFDSKMIHALLETFDALGRDSSVRVIILEGSGSTFCAGMDLQWFGADRSISVTEAQRDAERLLGLFRCIDECPCPVIGRIHGSTYGGGIGLIAVCDIAVADTAATFVFSEVRLGLVPAVIAPFVIRKTGESFVRRFCLTGEPCSAATAREFGLIHDVVEPAALHDRITALAEMIMPLAPAAVRDTKALVRRLRSMSDEEKWKAAVAANVSARLSSEAREGLLAFSERRTPVWNDASKENATTITG